MPTKVIAVIVGLIVVGGVVWLVMSPPTAEAPATSSESATRSAADSTGAVAQNNPLSGSGPLAALMSRGDSVQCDFESTSPEGVNSSGTFYYHQDKFRVVAQMLDGEGLVTSNIINNGELIYLWGENNGLEQGLIMAVPDETANGLPATPGVSQEDGEYFDVSEEVEYTCKNWNGDPTQFVPPTDVEFMDMTALFDDFLQELPPGFDPTQFPAVPPEAN